MKLQWSPQELIDHWTLTLKEITLIKSISQTEGNQLGCALLLKCFQNEGKFPQRKQDIPPVVVEHISQQLHISSSIFAAYQLKGRSVRRRQLRIRQLLQFRVGTVSDAKIVLDWLLTGYRHDFCVDVRLEVREKTRMVCPAQAMCSAACSHLYCLTHCDTVLLSLQPAPASCLNRDTMKKRRGHGLRKKQTRQTRKQAGFQRMLFTWLQPLQIFYTAKVK